MQSSSRLPQGRAMLKGGGNQKASQRQQKHTFIRTLSASLSWDLVYFKRWRLAVGGWWWFAVGGPRGLSFRAFLNQKKKRSGF